VRVRSAVVRSATSSCSRPRTSATSWTG